MGRRSLLLLCVWAVLPAPVHAWGAEGHRLIAALAAQHLGAKAREAVRRLLEPGETLESVSTWADEVRPRRPETAPWHYVNLPASRPAGGWAAHCPKEGCVASAVVAMREKLRAPGIGRQEQAEALKFFVHFLSDLHQPLHAGNAEDRGGNAIPVVFLGRATNLHSFWDTTLLQVLFERQPSKREALSSRLSESELRRLSHGGLEDWLWESRGLATTAAYAGVPETRPAALGEEYFDQAAAAAGIQIRRAGARLARELDAVFSR
jgi:hypothetical protein